MKEMNVKSLFCLLLCLSLLLTACGQDGASENGSVSSESAAPDIIREREWVFVPEVYTVGDRRADYERMQPVGDVFCYVLQGDTEDEAKSICRYSLTDRELKSVPIRWPEGGDDWDVGYRFFTPDQGLYMTANVYSADSGSMKRFLCRFDQEGNCLFSRDITDQAGSDVSLCGLTVDEQSRLCLLFDNGEILLYAGDGDYHGSVRYSSPENQGPGQIRGACEGADGKFYVCISRGNAAVAWGNAGGNQGGAGDDGIRCTLMELDFENARLLEVAGNLPSISGLCGGIRRESDLAGRRSGVAGQNNDSAEQVSDFAGQGFTGRGSDSAERAGDSTEQSNGSAEQDNGSAGRDGNPAPGSIDWASKYDLLLYDDKAVYGYRFDAGNPEPAGEELFLWMDCDINGYCVANLYLLEDGRLCATVEDWMNDDRAIVALERTSAEQAPRREELVLATVDGGSDLATMAVKFNRGNSRYRLTVKYYESLTDLYNAVLTKEPLDLIDLSGVNVQKLAARGLLEDLTPYVNQSELLAPSDFVDGILDVYTCGDTLVGIPAEFMIRTVVGNRTQLDDPRGLTLEELFSIEERHPGAKAFDGVTREEMMQYLMMFNEDTFIDWDTGTCHFDSESFQELLAYVSQYPDSVAGGREEEPLSARIQKGEVLFAVAELYPPLILWDYVKMFGEDAACIGFPTADGRGGHLLVSSDAYGIAAVSEHKDSAWDFIEESLTQGKKGELYAELFISYPSLKKALDEKVEIAVEREEMDRDDISAVLELIPDATPFFSVKEDEIIRIINEEAPAYYSGQKSIDDVAGIIQNRIQLYVNEETSR